MKKILTRISAAVLTLALAVPAASAAPYQDIPDGAALVPEVEKAVEYGLMQGYTENTFGYSDPMTRAQFVTVLGRMMGWFDDDQTLKLYITPAMEVKYEEVSSTYWNAISCAAQWDVVETYMPFRPHDPITRGEMAEMLVRALGLKTAAQSLNSNRMLPFSEFNHHTPFTDLPDGNEGYISVAYSIGMTKGTSATTFTPSLTATRAQVAAMLVRIYEKLMHEPEFVHAFYAISSYEQLGFAPATDAVSAGWSRMTWDGEQALLSTTSANGNEYCIPSGYEEVADYLEDEKVPLHLSVVMFQADGVRELLASPEGRSQAVAEIIHELTVDYRKLRENPYSGVTIDFEGFGAEQRGNFVAFLTELKGELAALEKELFVCAAPVPVGSSVHQNAYDYRSIAAQADKLILMVHDYDARELLVGTQTYRYHPTAPLNEIYGDIRDVVEIVPPEKVLVAYSARNVAWQIDENNLLVSSTPVYVSNDTLARRLEQADTFKGWSGEYQQPYAIYTTEDGARYYVWYDNARSVELRQNAAHLLDCGGVSLWRLGTIPAYSHWNWADLLHS